MKQQSEPDFNEDFEWDETKANINLKTHRVSFEEAVTVFADSFSITFSDPDHSFEEQRFIVIGLSNKFRSLFVSFTERGKKTRIISAREVTAKERNSYEQKRRKF